MSTHTHYCFTGFYNSFYYIYYLVSYCKFTRENNFLALGVCFPQTCSSHVLERWPQVCCVKITFIVLPTNRSISTTQKSMKCVVNWIPLRIRLRSRNTQPNLEVGLGIFSKRTRILTPVAGSIFGPLSQTHFSKSEFKKEISSSALLDMIEGNLKNLKTSLINRTRLRTKGQSAGYPQAQIEIT